MTMSRSEAARLGGLARARQRTREDQVKAGRARARQMTTEERIAWGAKGWKVAADKYGIERIIEKCIKVQRAHPSPIEAEALRICHSLGLNVTHIFRPWSDRWLTVDIADLHLNLAIEVLGPPHYIEYKKPRRDYTAEKVERLRAEGWTVVLLECPDNRLPADAQSWIIDAALTCGWIPF